MTPSLTIPAPVSEQALCARFEEGLGRWSHRDANAKWRGRTLNAVLVVHIGQTPFLVRIERGDITQCTRTIPAFCDRDITLRGSLSAWSALWEPCPPPGWQDLLALIKRREMTLEGDMQKVFAHLQYLKDLIASPRGRAVA